MVHGALSAGTADSGDAANRNAALSGSPSLALGLIIGSVNALLRCESLARRLPMALVDIAGQKCTASQVLTGDGNHRCVRHGPRFRGLRRGPIGPCKPCCPPVKSLDTAAVPY